MIVWLASFPRSGNTFLRILLKASFGLESFSQYNDATDIGKDEELSATVGHQMYDGKWEDFYQAARSSDHMHLIKTHHPPKDDAPAIYIVREPRATLVSFHNYMTNFAELGTSRTETILGAAAFPSWGDHFDAWKPKTRPNTLFLKFEDLVANPTAAAKTIGEFLKIDTRDTSIPTFEELQKLSPRFFRTGSNAGNISAMTLDESNLVRFMFGDQMRSAGYPVEPRANRRMAINSISSVSSHLYALARKSTSQHQPLEAEQQRIKELHKKNADLDAKAQYLQNKMETLAQAKRETTAKWEQERGQIEGLWKSNSELKATVEHLRKKADELTSTSANLSAYLDKERSISLARGVQIEQSTRDAGAHAAREQELSFQINRLSEMSAIHAEDLRTSEAELKRQVAVVNSREKSLQTTRDRLAEARADAASSRKAIEILKATLTAERERLARMEDAVADLTAQKIERERHIDRIEADVLQFQERNARLAERGRHLQALNQASRERLVEVHSTVAPRLKTLLTLRPARFIFNQRKLLKQGLLTLDQDGVPTLTAAPVASDEPLAAERLRTQPSVLTGTGHRHSIYADATPSKPLGIAVYAFDRADSVEHVLESLMLQDALEHTHVFIDGDQGNPTRRKRIDETERVVASFPVRQVHRNRGNFGFRKMMILSMRTMMEQYERILFLEDDCFPTRFALKGFSSELDAVENDPAIMSVYGHPFQVESEEQGPIARFQGWGWATTRKKLKPFWKPLLDLYLMSESEYLAHMKEHLTPELIARLDVTPGRQPTSTLPRFFAWDETLGFLAARAGMTHKRTDERLIYNFGVGTTSTHFHNLDHYRRPPFNMVSMEELWERF